MSKKIIFILFVLIILMPFVLATDTTINIKTLLNHDVKIKILDPFPKEGESNVLEFFEENSGDNGEVSIISHASRPQIDVVVILEKYGERVLINEKYFHEFKKKTTGGIINLEVKEQPAEIVVEKNETAETNLTNESSDAGENESLEVNETAEEVSEEEGGKITGFIVEEGKAVITSEITYYIIGGIFIVGVLFFVIMAMKKRMGSGSDGANIKVKKMGEISDKKLEDIEKRVSDAKKEIDDIKNRKRRLEEARERFKKDQEELKKLEKEF